LVGLDPVAGAVAAELVIKSLERGILVIAPLVAGRRPTLVTRGRRGRILGPDKPGREGKRKHGKEKEETFHKKNPKKDPDD
jgi:hypothetical protein